MNTTGTPQPVPMNSKAMQDGPAGIPETDKLKRKRQPRNSACQACVSQKIKCVPEVNGKCERCNKTGRDCMPAIPKPRKRPTLNGSHPDGAAVYDFGGERLGAPGPSPRFDSPSSNRQSSYQADTSALLLRHDLSYTGSKAFISLFSRGLGNTSVCEELLQNVDYNFVVNCFTIFRQLTPHFPFVELSPAADVVSMVSRRPSLTLAICTVASASWPEIQDRLSQAFLYALSSKAMLSSESSIDLFTGLLVYLAWHHHYLPQQQTYQKLCLLAGMAGDLGLYQSSPSMMEDSGNALERDRAFVGCYYLCSTLSATGYNKPNPLRWTDHLRRAAESASRMGTLPTDRDLIPALELARTLDDLSDVLQEHSGVALKTTHCMDLHTRVALNQLKALKREHPSLASSLGYAAANLHVYQRSLRSSEVPDPATLIRCACAVKEYTDDLLARPASTLHQLAVVDWTNLLEILLLMAKVSKPSTGGWEAGALTSMLMPEAVLDSLYSHMASPPSNDPLSSRHEGLLRQFQSICEGIKRRFLLDAGPSGPVTAQADEPGGHLETAYNSLEPPQFDAYSYFGNGILDPSFWTSLTSGQSVNR